MSFQGEITQARGKLGDVIVARLAPGCDLKKSIEQVAEKAGIKYGLILGGAGSLSEVVLRNPKGFPDALPISDKFRVFVKKKEAMEMLSLAGNIAQHNGNIFIHGHIAISSGEEDGLAYGGHLDYGCTIYTTAEIAIAALDGVKMLRLHNEETKNHELCPVEEE